MTEDFIEYIKENYNEKYIKNYEESVREHNLKYEEALRKSNKIHEMLQEERIKEFANIIGYKEPILAIKKKELLDPLYVFVYDFMHSTYYDEKYIEKNDKYKILCFVKSTEAKVSVVTGKRICDYEDVYFNLQNQSYGIGSSDKHQTGKNRQKFIETHDIIYAPAGHTFFENDIIAKIQTEYIRETLTSNQESAKKLILSKYGKK